MVHYLQTARDIIDGKILSLEEAQQIITCSDKEIFALLAASNLLRYTFKQDGIKLCSIINAKSGKCSEDCSFCAQSVHFKTAVQTYPLLSSSEIAAAAKQSEDQMSASCFSIVTSGRGIISKEELNEIGQAVEEIVRNTHLNRCVSLGILSLEQLLFLKAKGLKRLHHNLETAESFFQNICTTHTYAQRLQTIKDAKQAGLEVCSGGIFGLGETITQRLELAFTLRDLKVESVPINILNPVAGTPAAEKHTPLAPLDVLRLIAVYRCILPQADIGVFGGREKSLRDLQPLMFAAGANVTLVGNYLTTCGQAPEKDLQMIKDLGLFAHMPLKSH